MYSRYNFEYVKKLLDTTYETLVENYNVKKENIWQYAVPGAYELPYTAYHLINYGKSENKPFDAVICIGAIIKKKLELNDTLHYISESISKSIMKTSIETDTPVIHGVLSDTEDNIKNNCGYFFGYNQALNWAETAIEMARVHSFKAKKIV